MSKNSTQLAMFSDFCRRHPELRFWQALSAWTNKKYIYTSDARIARALDDQGREIESVHDTFYIKDNED